MYKFKLPCCIKTIIIICILTCSITPEIAIAADPWQPLTQTIQRQLNPGNRAIGTVSVVQGSTVIINLLTPQATIGTTLAVKGNSLPGVALPLQNNIARIRITQINGRQGRGTILPGSEHFSAGVPLCPLAHNQV